MPKRPRKNKRILRKKFQTGVMRLRHYLNIYLMAKDIGVEATAKVLGLEVQVVYYWQRKFEDPGFHSDYHGGLRWAKWTGEERTRLLVSIWRICQENPLAGLKDFQLILQSDYGFAIAPSSGWLSRLFYLWRWSFKKPDVRQFNKYSAENIQYYAAFLYNIQDIPWHQIKYCDESHFDTRDLRKKTVLSPMNKPARVVVDNGPISKRFTLTLVTTLAEDAPIPVVFSLREDTNTAESFLEFVTFLVEKEHLKEGDYFIIDNAPIHTAEDELEVLVNLLFAYDIKLIFLPTYSPELNPCELVFAFIKRKIREHWKRDGRFDEEIVRSCLQVTYDNILNFYQKCIVDTLFDVDE